LTVDGTTVELGMADSPKWNDFSHVADRKISFENAQLTFSDPNHGFVTLSDNTFVDVEATSGAFLQDMRLKPGTKVALDRVIGEPLKLYITGGGASVNILVNGTVRVDWAKIGASMPLTRSFSVDIPERMTFTAPQQQGVPATILFEPDGPVMLRDFKVSSLRFGHESAHASEDPMFVSTVREGILRIPDVIENYDLSVGYSVILSGLEGHIQKLLIGEDAEDAIVVNFEGTVQRVAVGPQSRERDVTPTLLAYLYHNQRLAFLFTAASFLWGTLWSIRRLIGD